jgi:hypothetical protein
MLECMHYRPEKPAVYRPYGIENHTQRARKVAPTFKTATIELKLRPRLAN